MARSATRSGQAIAGSDVLGRVAVADGLPAARQPRRRSTPGWSWPLVLDDRMPAARKVAPRRGRAATSPSGATSSRTTSRSSAASTTSSSSSSRSTCSSTACPTSCSTRSSTSSASTGPAFDRDIAQIRRLTPGPVRRTIRRHPGASSTRRRDAIDAHPASGRGSGPGSTRRNPSREGHPDQGRRQARQERRDEGRRRRLRPNFLIPQKLAVPAAGGAYRAWQHDIASREDKRKREREEAEIAATRIAARPP